MTRSAAQERRRRRWLRRQNVLLGWVARRRPVSLTYWRLARRTLGWVFGPGDVLVPPEPSPCLASDPELQALGLNPRELGGWALEPDTVVLLARILESTRPNAILEFGAGVSSLLFARHARARSSQGQQVRVVSLEQDAGVAATVRQRLAGAGLSEVAQVLHAPLDALARYTIEADAIKSAIGGRQIDVILVDGPFGPPGCRVHTLPAVRPACAEGARWVLDDALRDGELSALRAWQGMPGLQVDGILPMGRGVALGTIGGGRRTSHADESTWA